MIPTALSMLERDQICREVRAVWAHVLTIVKAEEECHERMQVHDGGELGEGKKVRACEGTSPVCARREPEGGRALGYGRLWFNRGSALVVTAGGVEDPGPAALGLFKDHGAQCPGLTARPVLHTRATLSTRKHGRRGRKKHLLSFGPARLVVQLPPGLLLWARDT